MSLPSRFFFFGIFLSMFTQPGNAQHQGEQPLRMAVLGLSHGHSHWIFNQERPGIEIVGIYEPNKELAKKFREQYQLEEELFYSDLEQLLDREKPEAAVAFGSVFQHLEAVMAAAPRGIHVMVEKPLAVNMEHAEEMARLAKENNIHLLTNYETSWYPTTEKTLMIFQEKQLGEITRMVFHHGHQGPKEIGVGPEFLEWLIDPELNGGGALMDFGCYGANIMTALKNGERPVSVTAITKTYKPEVYKEVEDDATIIVNYENSIGIIQASWNWPFNRKDMEIYGETGFVKTANDAKMQVKNKETEQDLELETSLIEQDPFLYFKKVIRGEIKVPPYNLYSLENNLLVVEILEAALFSAEKRETVNLSKQD